MKHYLGPLVCALVAACSSNREPASSYDARNVAADDTEQEFVPASSDAVVPASSGAVEPVSSDAVDAATDQPARDVAPVPKDAAPERSAPDTIPPATQGRETTPPSRDTAPAALTPIDQGNNEADLETTQKIRKAVVGDDSLSFNAKNVKIITLNGKVTLRGSVNSAKERERIAAFARKVAGAANVDNQLEVAK